MEPIRIVVCGAEEEVELRVNFLWTPTLRFLKRLSEPLLPLPAPHPSPVFFASLATCKPFTMDVPVLAQLFLLVV